MPSRAAPSRTFVTGGEPDRHAEHVGEHLPPQRAAASPPVARTWRTALPAALIDCEDQGELQADPFEGGPDQMRPPVGPRVSPT